MGDNLRKKMFVYIFSRTLFQRKLKTLLKALVSHPMAILSQTIDLTRITNHRGKERLRFLFHQRNHQQN
jgi:hypothetical protein